MNLAQQLHQYVKETSNIRIVVIGDRMVDRWHHGYLSDCQDGCQKFVVEQSVDTPGGAANAHRSLREWDVRVSLHSYVVDIPIKRRYVNTDGRIVFRADTERNVKDLTPESMLQRAAMSSVKQASAVLLSDYDKGFLTPEFIREVVAACREVGVPCVADCKRAGDLYEGCTIKGNAMFFEKTENLDYSLVQSRGHGLIMTRGCHSPLVYETGKVMHGSRSTTEPTQIPGLTPVPCVNPVGAGDCFAAHLTLALACGFHLEDAAAVAHSAGRVYVQRPHNHPPTPAEVADDMDRKTLPPVARG